MPVSPVDGASGNGVAFVVGAGLVYEIIAAACSSPQTAEINADKRASTLMKWVHIGLVQSAGFILIACVIDPKHAKAILSGGMLAAGVMYVSYTHALEVGLSSSEEGTET